VRSDEAALGGFQWPCRAGHSRHMCTFLDVAQRKPNWESNRH